MKTVYAVWANSDSTEGRGVDEIKFLCDSEDLAVKLSKKLGPMGGSDGRVEKTFILESAEEESLLYKKEKITRILRNLSQKDTDILRDYFAEEPK